LSITNLTRNSIKYTALGNCKMIVAIRVNANKKLSEKLTMTGDKYVVLEYTFVTKKLISQPGN
jgi:hypothetical protein